jgi:N-acyl homoserine lactone hydrolase
MMLYHLPTGVTHRSAGFAYRGGSFRDARDFTMSAVLVSHPKGDLLIDAGFGRDIDTQFRLMPWLFRVATSYARGRAAADQLDAAGYNRNRLRAILLTHAHWDHVSGVPDFPGTNVLVTREERAFIDNGGALTAVARSAHDAHYETLTFLDRPYLGFLQSCDYYGDGSVVVVPAPGHTPGSVVVFVNLPNAKRYAFIGDMAWQREGVSERQERPWLARTMADWDAAGVRDGLTHMFAIAQRYPEIEVVPAHDSRSFASIARLPEHF